MFICPTTNLAFVPVERRRSDVPGFRWARCEHCDALGRINGDPEFDPEQLQWHAIEISPLASLMVAAHQAAWLSSQRSSSAPAT